MRRFCLAFLLVAALAGCGKKENASLPELPKDVGLEALEDAKIPVNTTVLQRAHFHEQMKRLPEAQIDLDKGLQSHPEDVTLNVEHARVVAMQGKTELALSEIEELRKKFPKEPKILVAKIDILAHVSNKFIGGITALEDVIKLYPKSPEPVCELGRYEAEYRHDLPLALADFNRAIQLDPKFAPAYLQRGQAYAASGDFKRALSDADQAVKLTPTDSQAWLQRALTYLSLKQYKVCRENLEQIMKLQNDPMAIGAAISLVHQNPQLRKNTPNH